MPSTSATLCSPLSSRCSVVQHEPSPRERSARQKLHTAGNSEAQNDTPPTADSSSRPFRQGISSTGARCMCSAR
ncbi:Uncharacterised protein [Mycobacterium tuberculosis]|uniref:Uncharacterized protein n=1 Tax=Mycobacterium tuberculosis TaxID=1773 RepID=A0A655JTT4_MYCTX|nr:Uncharacterised protein [Mycobacterium tuberculosis]COY30252.1 Uncharacterised protein [Mycobacterium tuberculosis]CPA61062.1 Uncharacterised protein [Mycobacterium tuberculosis]CPB05030.1 Uncharacterised protein [Mycobacterium tuberculosis]